MADVVKYRFVWRGRTAANWTALNEVLLEKEAGIELDTMPRKWKIGDGVTPWNSLPYQSGIDIDDTNIGDGRALVWNAAVDAHEYADVVKTVTAGANITVNDSDPQNLTIDSNLGVVGLKGRVANYAALPSSGNTAGDAYLNDADKLIYIWDGSAWPANGSGFSGGAGTSNANIIQQGFAKNTNSGTQVAFNVVLPSSPTVGNWLILILSGYDSTGTSLLTLPSGFSQIYKSSANNQGYVVGARKVQSGDGTSYSCSGYGTASCGLMLEVENLKYISTQSIQTLGTNTTPTITNLANKEKKITICTLEYDQKIEMSSLVGGNNTLIASTYPLGSNNHPSYFFTIDFFDLIVFTAASNFSSNAQKNSVFSVLELN